MKQRHLLSTEVITENGLELRAVVRVDKVNGKDLPIPELRHGEVMTLGSDGRIRITASRGSR